MATNKLFSVVGISKGDKGDYKVRFANDIGRVKVLTRAGHEDIRLAELPEAVTKLEAVKAILDMAEFQDSVSQQLFDDYIAEHGELAKPKKAKKTKTASVTMSLEDALAQIPKRDDKGHFIKKEVREQMAQELLEAQ